MTKQELTNKIQEQAKKDYARGISMTGLSGELVKYAVTNDLANDTMSDSEALGVYAAAHTEADMDWFLGNK